MPALVFGLIALIGAAIHVRRHRDEASPAFAVDTFFVWWMVVLLGVGSIVGAAFHLFDGPQIAAEIGYTRGNGGFQFENAMGDLAIGVAAVLAFRYRGYYWLCLLIVVSIQYFGDAGGHIYYWLEDDNTKPDNVGAPLVEDIVGPIVAIVLYRMSWVRGGDARPRPDAGAG